MVNSKKILLIFSVNFLKHDKGCSNAVYIPVKILKSLGFSIDLFSISKHEDFSDFSFYNKDNLIENLYLDGIKTNYLLEKQNRKIFKKNILTKLFNFIIRIIKKIYRAITLQKFFLYPNSYVSYTLIKRFQKIIKSNNYNYIYVHYIHWADLFRYSNIPENTKLIYNMHDSHFIQQLYFNQIKIKNIGKAFMNELNALKYFHRYICISFDEMLFWSKLLPNREFYFCPPVNQINRTPHNNKNIDVLYLGALNPFNIEGVCWFLDEVFPLLNKNISITFCGKFLSGLESSYIEKIRKNNIKTIDFAEDLRDLYTKTKIAIIPILNGTGIKIKTIEALSYSIPVVSTLLGVDGFPDKFESGCLVSNNPVKFASYIENLLGSNEYYEEIINKQTAYFNKYFSYERSKSIIEEVFSENNDNTLNVI